MASPNKESNSAPSLGEMIGGIPASIGGVSEGAKTLTVSEAPDTSTEQVAEPSVVEGGESVDTSIDASAETEVETTGEESTTTAAEDDSSGDIATDDEFDIRRGIKDKDVVAKAKAAETAKAKETADKAKPEVKAKTPPDVKPTTPPPAKPLPAARDYTGFEPNEVAVLKRMSNEAYAHVAPIMKEHKVLKTQVEDLNASLKTTQEHIPPAAYFDRTGYVENEQWHAATQAVDQGKALSDYYQKQLVACKSGEKWRDLVSDGKGGYTEVERDPSTAYEVALINRINQVNNEIQRQSTNAENIKHNHIAKIEQWEKGWKAEADKFFPHLKGKESEDPYVKAIYSIMAERGQKNNPVTDMFAKLYSTHMTLRNDHAKLLAQLQAAQGTKTVAASATPSSAALVTGASGGKTVAAKAKSEDWASDEEFARIRE